MKVIVEFCRALGWPLVVVFLTLLFRKDIKGLLDRLKTAEFPGGSVEFRDYQEWAAEAKLEQKPGGTAQELSMLISEGAYSNDYRAIFLVVGLANRGKNPDQLVSWTLRFPSLKLDLSPTLAPPNLVGGTPWFSSLLVKLPPNEFIQGGLFFRGRDALKQGLPEEPLSGILVAETLQGQRLEAGLRVYRISTLKQRSPA